MTSPEASSTTLFFGMSLDMMIGMALGMIASPLMMKGIKILRHKRKMNRLFNEIAQTRRNEGTEDLLYDSGKW
jgi:Tfp pilus assembly protein FimT